MGFSPHTLGLYCGPLPGRPPGRQPGVMLRWHVPIGGAVGSSSQSLLLKFLPFSDSCNDRKTSFRISIQLQVQFETQFQFQTHQVQIQTKKHTEKT